VTSIRATRRSSRNPVLRHWSARRVTRCAPTRPRSTRTLASAPKLPVAP